MLNKLRLSTRILSVGVLITLGFSCLLVWLYPTIRRTAYDAKRLKTRHLVETAWSVLDFYEKQRLSNALNREQAQAMAVETLKHMRYGQNDYFWINDQQPRMIMHPTNAALNGKDLSDYQDPNGFRLFVEMTRVCRTSGEGLVEYMWAKPGATQPVPKISYVKQFAPWEWIVGSGIYVDDVEAELARMATVLFVAAGLVCGGSLALAWFTARSISRPVQRIVGDLTQSSQQLASSAGEIAAASQSVSEGASEQAASVQQTSATLQELTATVQENAAGAQQIDRLMMDVSHMVEDVGQRMGQMSVAIQQINKAGEEVKKIIKTIDNIAFQTNLLALNAAVEAARAGEAGLGFAVVADEVRTLAQRAAEASKETAEKIGDSIARSGQGAKITAEVTQSFEHIVARVKEVQGKISEIVVSSKTQSEGIGQINAATGQINQITQRNAGSAEETASAAKELEAQSGSIKELVGDLLQVTVGHQ